MHIEPAVQYHVEAMIAIARADRRGVDVAGLTRLLGMSPEKAGELVGNLAAGGLVCIVGEGRHAGSSGYRRPWAYRLARTPENIGLDEIAMVAGPGAEAESASAPVSAADAGTRLLIGSMVRQALGALARFTLADVLAPDAPGLIESSLLAGARGGASSGIAAQGQESVVLGRLGITVNDLLGCVESGEQPVVLDVRSHPSARCPAPAWAHWIALEDLADHVNDWPLDTRIVTVCRLGVRSLFAASYLRLHGFSRADPLIGGLDAWHRVPR